MSRPVLITGATGYVGGRLLHRLEERGDDITCLARTPDNLEPRCRPTEAFYDRSRRCPLGSEREQCRRTHGIPP